MNIRGLQLLENRYLYMMYNKSEEATMDISSLSVKQRSK